MCSGSGARWGAVVLGGGAVDGFILEARAARVDLGTIRCFYLPALDRTMAEIDLETKLGSVIAGVPWRHCFRSCLRDVPYLRYRGMNSCEVERLDGVIQDTNNA